MQIQTSIANTRRPTLKPDVPAVQTQQVLTLNAKLNVQVPRARHFVADCDTVYMTRTHVY